MLEIKILSPSECIYEGKVTHVTFPGELGSFTVFPMHAPLISTLVKGNIVCYPANGDQQIFPVVSGFVEVTADRITACIE